TSIVINSIIAIIITGILVTTIVFNICMRVQVKKVEIVQAVDAIIEDGNGKIVLIKRKYPPFQGFYALPGGSVEKGEKLKEALIREVKEETNLDVMVAEKIGLYDEEGRDPKGKVHSTAFKCVIIGDISDIKRGEETEDVNLFSKEQVKEMELGFDHKKMLKDANFI
ncbi:MAG: NUDIX domain-containing protein, partial [Candidatus Hodarchaeota archaeon]